MERAKVVVRRPVNQGESARVATVLSEAGKPTVAYRVRWDDTGEEEDLRLGRHNLLVVRGSLRHEWLMDPGSVPEAFRKDPHGLIIRVLCESDKPLTAKRLIEQLVNLGVDAEAASAGWAATRRKFNESDLERTGKGSGSTYRWRGSRGPGADRAGSVTDDRTETAGRRDAPPDQPDLPIVTTAPENSTAAPVDPELPAAEPSGKEPDEGPVTLADALARVLGAESEGGMDEIVRRPLWLGVRLGRLTESSLSDLLHSLTGADRIRATGLLLALPRQSDALESPENSSALDAQTIDDILAVAAAELCTAAESSAGSEAAVAWLIRRTASLARPAAAQPLVQLAEFLARARQPDLTALDEAARMLGRALPLLPPDDLVAVDRAALSVVAVQLPLTVNGGRAALLAGLAKASPEDIAEPVWWSGVTLRSLAECGAGLLGGVTSMPEVVARVLRPLVIENLTAVSSRAQLVHLLGLPSEFFAEVPAEAVAAAFRRTGRADPTVAGWVRALADDDSLDSLKRDLEQAHHELTTEGKRAETAEHRAREFAERCDRLEGMLRREHAQGAAVRLSQERQIRIDVVRALADLAAEVEELAVNHLGPEVLVERVRGLVAAQALEPVGTAGATVAYDPAVHEPVHGVPDVGSSVGVVRPGYLWRSGSEEILIHKTLVAPG
ncbi:hypothetical protein ABNF97_21385 [Plantactinospora sp. B6F1]|uniref:hypothetical protein n=1 Tax=Plantactinospora sp. B6F1 TaxID=3158971 RepID=UPI0032D8B57E